MKELAGVFFTCNVGCPVDAGPIHLFGSSEELSVKQEKKQTPMKSVPRILHLGLDVHNE
jgi:hypothetical protein